jgi:hypothetical protein
MHSFQSDQRVDTNDSARVSLAGNDNIINDHQSIDSQQQDPHLDEFYVRLGSRRVLAIRRPNVDDGGDAPVHVEEISRQEMAERMARRGMN